MRHLASNQTNGCRIIVGSILCCEHETGHCYTICLLDKFGCTALAPRVKCQLVEVRVTHQGTPRDGQYIEYHAHKDLYGKMFIATLFITVQKDRT